MQAVNNFRVNNKFYGNKTSAVSFGIRKKLVMTDDVLLKLPEHLQKQVQELKSQPSAAMPQAPLSGDTTALLKQLDTLQRSINRQINEFRKMITGGAKSPKAKATIANIDASDIDKTLKKVTTYTYKNKKLDAFNRILESKDCNKEHVEDILNDLCKKRNGILKEHRLPVMNKIVDFACKTKDDALIKKILDTDVTVLPAEHWEEPAIKLMDYAFENSKKNIGAVETFLHFKKRIKDQKHLAGIYNHAMLLASKSKNILVFWNVNERLRTYCTFPNFSNANVEKMLGSALNLLEDLDTKNQRAEFTHGKAPFPHIRTLLFEVAGSMRWTSKEFQDNVKKQHEKFFEDKGVGLV